ncbi:cytochrome-c peroxidase [Exilibacterium tricleocarpae]|uniref:cytochrome-c peroxidase n=1 Tax=Exilibacterium tricleocarpae TaxID=2591008 RepID=UPI0015D122DC|nr:cytochrome c peroxidase [Exilibacterium tricleocarpae]
MFFAAATAFAQTDQPPTDVYAFTDSDIAFLKHFSLSSLSPPPLSQSNDHADDLAAAKLGKKIFFDKRLSRRGRFSCASCHQPDKYFTDGRARGVAFGTGRRSTPTLLGSAWSPWQYWDGRKDSLWAQALAPIEDPVEMNTSRTSFVRRVIKYHGAEYQAVFGRLENIRQLRRLPKNATPLGNARAKKRWQKLPAGRRHLTNTVFSNVGKSLMAYQRRLRIPPSRFDHFIDHLQRKNSGAYRAMLTAEEVSGLRIFMGKANCSSCHNGPLFTNFEFHNIGAPEPDPSRVDLGRFSGIAALVEDEFTCLSAWSDAEPTQCEEMNFLKRSGPELVGAFKTPTLRNIAATAPYMQAGQFSDLPAVLAHYNLPTPPFYDREQHPNRPHFDILPLKLTPQETAALIAFLGTLTSPYPRRDFWWNADIKD